VDRSAGTGRLYLDGIARTQTPLGAGDCQHQGPVNVGWFTNSTGFYFKGVLDEVRIENGTRSSNWIWATTTTVVSNATLASYSAVTQQSPALSLSAGASGLQAAWPSSGVGFALYTATNLASPVAWSALTNQPVWTNTQWQINLPGDPSATRFYRLESR